MAGYLQHKHIDGMARDGRTPIKTARDIEQLDELHTIMGDTRLILDGGCDNRKLRFELSKDGGIRCAYGHSAGIGARPDALPVAADLNYISRGTSMEPPELPPKRIVAETSTKYPLLRAR